MCCYVRGAWPWRAPGLNPASWPVVIPAASRNENFAYLRSRQPCAAVPRPRRHRSELTNHIHNSPERADRARARHPSPAWHLPCICRHASVGVKRKQRRLASKKRYERAAGARVLDRVHTQWVPVSVHGVQERCLCGRTVPYEPRSPSDGPTADFFRIRERFETAAVTTGRVSRCLSGIRSGAQL